ncbi:diguanylate cyclase (GGDEF)-like protein [Rheinheimera pacifica]|uniref:diguanylate cyclase domain-containing protein n=1 Tax=Rheinheimera pacifica TaxID=173990 RepID=UPI00216A29D7|nr:diguanylate cyclase [Rheinheimera pacifica]MCS4308641.1 diguanylate cyclase (GGDEF)-like protein [Rheinheimera pacifica]
MQDVSTGSTQLQYLDDIEPASKLVATIDFSALNTAFNNARQLLGSPVVLLDINGKLLASSDWPDARNDLAQATEICAGYNQQDYATPIMLDGEHIASLLVGKRQLNNSNMDKTQLNSIAQILATLTLQIIKLSLINTRYQQHLQQTTRKVAQHTQELLLQNQILSQISEGAELKSILHTLVTQVELLHPEMLCSILLLDEESQTLHHGAAPSLPDEYNNALDGVTIGMAIGSCGTAAFTGETVIVTDISTHPYWQPYQALAQLADVKACWSQPVKNAQGKVLGTFAIYHHQPASPSTDQLNIIKAYSNLAELAISRSLSAAQIRRLAFYDNLTGLANRRLLEEHLLQAIASSQRSQKYSGLMFIDLDNFKPVNDIYGHKKGDNLLADVASRLLSTVRQTDTVARFGGDEFIVLLRDIDTDADRSKHYIQQIATKISQELSRPYPLSENNMHQCACSIGLVLFQGSNTSDELLRQADTAMYQAKRQGRNQPCWFSG